MNGLRLDWNGRLTATPTALQGLWNEHGGRLRLPSGSEAPIHIVDPSTAPQAGYFDILGDDDAPF
jgi:hypothetical protein